MSDRDKATLKRLMRTTSKHTFYLQGLQLCQEYIEAHTKMYEKDGIQNG